MPINQIQIRDLSTGLINSKITVPTDSATAFQVTKANGTTAVINVNTNTNLVTVPNLQLSSTAYQYFPAVADTDTVNDKRLKGDGTWEKCTVGNGTLGAGTWVSVTTPAALTNNLGGWDANDNLPEIISGTGTGGDWYTVTTAGATPIDGISPWGIGDYIWFDGSTSTWQKVNNQVTSVAPGGVNTSVQYNNAGALGGDANFLRDATNNQLVCKTTAIQQGQTLGAEILTGVGWTLGAGWAGAGLAYTHTAGNTATLTNSTAIGLNIIYQLGVTITGRTAGSVSITFGGLASGTLTGNSTVIGRTLTAAGLVITPTTDFDGTVTLSLKQSSATYGSPIRVLDSTGLASLEMRTQAAALKNTCFGVEAGRSVSTGVQNTIFGYQAGILVSNGNNNSVFGYFAAPSITSGANNVAFGYGSLLGIATTSNNTAVGNNSGRGLTSATNCTFVGSEAGNTGQFASAINSGAFGYGAYTTLSNSIVIGNTDVTKIGMGIYTPTAKLDVVALAETAVAEKILKLSVSDDTNSYILFENSVATGSRCAPAITAQSGNAADSPFYFNALLPTDSGAKEAILFKATVSGGAVATRPIFAIDNHTTRLAHLAANGNLGLGTITPKSKLQVNGGIQCADDADVASADKVGTFRYRVSGNNSYVEVCVQTGASSYAWQTIITNSW